MTLLIISPDYASHLLPLATLGTAWRDAGDRVVVATGPATAAIVESFGYERVELRLGKGSNPGTIRPEDQPKGEDNALRGFFDATRRGMIETLSFQAEARLSDLMWEPARVAREVLAVVRSVSPDVILVDHLAFSARLALDSAKIFYGDVVLGHPSALPIEGEIYGFPPAWPAAFTPSADQVAALRKLCVRVDASFTAEWNAALRELDPQAPPSPSAFAEHGPALLFNYPAELSGPRDTAIFLGSAIRDEALDSEVEAWLDSSKEPYVYVSFGSFLSVRADVLQRVADAIASLGLRAAIATGESALEGVPADWLVRAFLPQVRLLSRAAAAVSHGGNNSVTEAMSCGVPLVVLPFSTDQFAGAAAIEAAGYGVALAPNDASVDELAVAITRVLQSGPVAIGSALREKTGPARAYAALQVMG